MSNPLSFLWGSKGPRVRGKGGKRKSGSRPRGHQTGEIQAMEKLVVEEIEVADVGAPRLATAAPSRRRRRSRRSPALRAAFTWTGLWLLLVMAALFARSPWPLDETRTLAVAWEMWSHGGTLVPTLNGVTYTEQAPLLFWLINLGWQVFGINDWWPRVLPALFGLASIFLTGRLANRLWPDQKNVARYVPVLLIGMVFWAFYLTLALADMLTVCFTLLAMIGLVHMWQYQRHRGWLLLGSSLGLGMLASGIGILVYVAPPVLLLPFWASGNTRPRAGRWYADVLKAVMFALVIVVLSIFLFAKEGGGRYTLSLISGPLPAAPLDLFTSTRPWWWYLAALPVVLLPWAIFPLIWMRLWYIRSEQTNLGFAFCLFWAWPVIIVLTVLGAKQPQFLLPVIPAFALGMAYLLLAEELKYVRSDSIFSSMAFPIIVLGGALAAVPGLPRVEALPDLLWEPRAVFIGLAIAGVGILLAWLPLAETRQRMSNIAVGGVAVLVVTLLTIGSQFEKLYNIDQIAGYIAAAVRQERAIAHVGPYAGQFQFAGRLTTPLEVIDVTEVAAWCAEHLDGLVITYTDVWQPRAATQASPLLEAPFRDQRVRIWDTGTIIAGGF
jgi:4-amino-4-deoxy-L-arabinose transferase-like glycosyltransferase